ncbi:TonB-dependent receptor [bacterium]|nr:TonB-dependent receptor [bacterium]
MKFYTLFFLAFLMHNLDAQELEGYIYNYDNSPIEWANIINYTKSEHSHSGPNGYFKIKNCSIGDSLVVSFLGYKSQSFELKAFDKLLQIKLAVKSVSIDEVVISPTIDALHLFTDINTSINPVSSSQEVLTQVPGLFIGQHAGGGKAEQIFLRGFDIDHGTDISISVDGLPVNMVSHAHGQGYADLHFLIPETIENIDFGKGSYSADKGNFTTAGFVEFNTKKKLNHNLLKLEAGQFDMQRIMTMYSLVDNKKTSAYIAGEHISNNGFFESPQNFRRTNVFGKLSEKLSDKQTLTLTASHFTSRWDASGQIPGRSVADNSITRFGAIDDTEGGQTSRTNLLLEYAQTIGNNTFFINSIFFTHYDFELFSNFTFFLNDPINGDQIKQFEDRNIWGLNSEYSKIIELGQVNMNWKAGLNFRYDNSNDNELSRTANRTDVLERIKLGNVNESNLGLYIKNEIVFGNLIISPGLRFDYFIFNYQDALSQTYSNSTNTAKIFSPKLSGVYQHNNNFQSYIKLGQGFHSNDSRVVVQQEATETLPKSLNVDAGIIWKPRPKLLVNTGLWYLYLNQEFVYVGDEGIVELSGETKRQGLDLSIRYEPLNQLFLTVDANYTIARSINETKGEDYIPLAPDLTITSSLKYISNSGLYGGVDFKYLDNRPANENNSIVAEGYGIFDVNLGYKFHHFNFGIQIENVMNSEWNETQFATTSRLANESNAVEEIHFTPGTPFKIKGSIAYNF